MIEDFDTVTSPDKIASVLNQAVKEAAGDMMANTRADRTHLAPKDDDALVAPPRVSPVREIVNAKPGARKPLALRADRAHLAPQGE
ncbi:hypothetical protein [Sphingomonas aracearum]|nr:hypothetical protein [Sphingomonas aracearum]